MKITIYLIPFFFGFILARPQNDVQIISYSSRNLGDGTYEFSYELSDGTKRQESGHLENAAAAGEEPSLSVIGSYSYVSPDGKVVEQNYKADKDGFQPQTGQAVQGGQQPRPPATAFASPLSVAKDLLGGKR